MLDLNGFKLINDAYGHAVGDQALIEFAQRISATMRAEAVLIRIGRDEFAVIIPNVASLDAPASLAQRIVAAVAEPFQIEHIGIGWCRCWNSNSAIGWHGPRAARSTSRPRFISCQGGGPFLYPLF
jgi:GGDEF domain-containing protein